jgi:putative redox protein
LQLLGRQVGHLVVGATQLEAEHRLLVFALQQHLVVQAAAQVGHTLMMDGAPDEAKPENGGLNLAPRPLETLLAGTGGCTAYDVVLILKRGRHAVQGCTVKLTAERAETEPKVFTTIHMHFTVTGKGVPAAAVERAVAMSHEKYCSASIMLAKTADITTSFEVVEA